MKYKHVEPIQKDKKHLVKLVDILSRYQDDARKKLENARNADQAHPEDRHVELVTWLNIQFPTRGTVESVGAAEVPMMIQDALIFIVTLINEEMSTLEALKHTGAPTSTVEESINRMEKALHELVHVSYLAGRMGVGAVDEEDETLEALNEINFGDLKFLEDEIDEHEDE